MVKKIKRQQVINKTEITFDVNYNISGVLYEKGKTYKAEKSFIKLLNSIKAKYRII